MTLIAGVNAYGFPLVIGDILVTREGGGESNIGIPHNRKINRKLPLDAHFSVSGLRQKVNILSEQLAFAVAGDAKQAHDFLETMRNCCFKQNLSFDRLQQVLAAIEPSRTNKLQAIGIFLSKSDNEYPQTIAFNCDYIQGKGFDLVLGGSGTNTFLETVREASTQWPEKSSEAETNYTNAHSVGLSLLGHLTGQEYINGENINERWGGGFELLSVRLGKLKKFDKIIHLVWNLVKDGDGRYMLLLLPKVIKFEYWNDLLIIRNFQIGNGFELNRELDRSVHVVTPILYDEGPIDLENLPAASDRIDVICNHIVPDNTTGGRCSTHVSWDYEGINWFKYTVGNSSTEIEMSSELISVLSTTVSNNYGIAISSFGTAQLKD